MKSAYQGACLFGFLLAIAGCATIPQEILDTATAREALLQIAGSAQYIHLDYRLIEHEDKKWEVTQVPAQLGNDPLTERLPFTRKFLVNNGDILYIHCDLESIEGEAFVTLDLEGKTIRTYDLNDRRKRIYLKQEF